MVITGFAVVSSDGSKIGYTDSPPDGGPGSGDCSSCHGGGTATPVPKLTANPSFGTGNTYVPGATYTLSFQVTGYPYFGFDLEMINSTTSSAGDGGVFGSAISHCQITPGNSTSYSTVTNVTHTAKIPSSSQASWKWTAPDSGTVYVWAAANGVNGDGGDRGDKYAPYTVQLYPSTTSIQLVSTNKSGIRLFPNPATDHLNVRCDLIKAGEVGLEIHDVFGKLVASQEFPIQNAGPCSLNLVFPSPLAKGLYSLSLRADGTQSVKNFIVK